jgi:SAM-dependent methyltransferase
MALWVSWTVAGGLQVEPLPDWAPENADVTKASAARMYDYYLGGAHNFAVDRELARMALALVPDGQLIAQANRAFLHRAVQYLLAQGVRQFIDIGSGIPTAGNVHEIAQREAPESRVLYVDHDPVAVAHSELILHGNRGARVLHADLRRPEEIIDAPMLAELLDLSQPVGVLMVAVLHFVSESDRPDDAIKQFRDLVSPGSYLAISQGTGESRTAETKQAAELYRSTDTPVTFRSREQVRELFQGWELVEPGVVWVSEWRPDWPDDVGSDPAFTSLAAAVGRKP